MAKFQRETLGITEAVQYNSNLVYNNMVLGAKAALAGGVPVGMGTDTGCPYTTHYNMWRELHYFQKEVGVGRLPCPGAAIYGGGSRQGLRPSANQKIPCLRCGTGQVL